MYLKVLIRPWSLNFFASALNKYAVSSKLYWPGSEKIESINDILSSQDNTLKNEALSALVVLGIERKKANIEFLKSNDGGALVEISWNNKDFIWN